MKSQRIPVAVNKENTQEEAARKTRATTSKYMASDFRKFTENAKRQAEESPNNAPTRKRSALGDVTNASQVELVSKDSKAKYIIKPKVEKNANRLSSTIQTRQRSMESASVVKKNAKNKAETLQGAGKNVEIEKPSITDTDLDDILLTELTEKTQFDQSDKTLGSTVDSITEEEMATINAAEIDDIDLDVTDEFAVAEYANEIFKNMKNREEMYVLTPYMSKRSKLNGNMRAILVDWLVEVQENFELYHETLYLAVKIVDHYLEKNDIERDQLQLLGATAVFLACKIEEKHPPYLDDFLFICDDAYNKADLLKMEMRVFASLDFCLAIPIPYRFLRRYAKAAHASMETLTLARYILETSLLEYDFITLKSSKMAAACLALAMAMKKLGSWTPTLEYYTGYSRTDLTELVGKLNVLISVQPKKNLKTIHSKYSHPVFFEVAKTPILNVLAK
ncbi:G2/mitotic-specific cyclin-B3-like isoform X1 [Xenia sp. Carnegie-2017]|uniref:G2/mitotic-specific cyclin-B3-like isoform X1 n=1 Tax=Xenia sp. Carnegie-2017 TaxID=2897299 RepID=UPI001F04ACD8|nr:G2/mitotic-specific cyclin-B3-like isoform X1 [Xenia sp. Carnegie-2017]